MYARLCPQCFLQAISAAAAAAAGLGELVPAMAELADLFGRDGLIACDLFVSIAYKFSPL